NYALNAANLSALLWQADESDEAVTWMERAVELAPRSSLFALNMGLLYEKLGQEDSAARHYAAALDHAPHWAEAFFWRATPLRAVAKQKWIDSPPDPEPVEARSTEWYEAGRLALTDGDYDEALRAFDRALKLNPRYAAAYIAQAEVHRALDHHDRADRLLRTALLVAGGELSGARTRMTVANLYHEQGRLREAISLAEESLDIAQNPATHIAGRLNSADYGWYIFHSETIYASLLPQLAVITVTDEVAEWMLELGAWYEEAGDDAAAAAVYREVLEEVPDCEAARERVAEVEG
ncbi:MAG: tetratricopeptide repeat protein, partial [Planctomycetota bacterium]